MNYGFTEQKRAHRIGLVAVIVALMQPAAYAEGPSPFNRIRLGAGNAAKQSEVRKLEARKPIERELSGGGSHTYEITLDARQYLNTVVDQRGIDVAIQLLTPDGKLVRVVNGWSGTQGQEVVEYISESSGSYQLKVIPIVKDAPAGRYEIKIVLLRAATEWDLERQEARRLDEEASRLYEAGNYDQAVRKAERAVELWKKTVGPRHSIVANSLNNLAVYSLRQGEYTKVESLYKEARAIWEADKDVGPEHPLVAAVLNGLAELYRETAEYDKAEPLYHKAREINEKTYGPEDPRVALNLTNLGILYFNKGDYEKAGLQYQQARAIYEKALGPEHSLVAFPLSGLAGVYQERGDYAQAEPLLERVRAIYEKALGQEHPTTASAISFLAGLYLDKGDYAKAEELYKQSQAIYEKVLGQEHPNVADLLNSLARLYELKGDYAKAKQLYERTQKIYEKVIGLAHPVVARTLNNLALSYHEQGDLAKAEPLYRRAQAIWEKALGPEDVTAATAANNLAALYYFRGNYAKAEELYQKAQAIWEKARGSEHPEVANVLNNLAALYDSKGNAAKAVAFRTRATNISEHNITLNLAASSERQKMLYLTTFSRETHQVLSLQVKSAPHDPLAIRLALATVLRRKGRTLDAVTNAIGALRHHASAEDRKLLDQLASALSQLAALTIRGPGKEGVERYRANLKSLEEKAEKLEGDVSRQSAKFRAQSIPVTIENVQKVIPPEAALVEFFSYRPFNRKKLKKEEQLGDPRYVAYVLRHKDEPTWVEIGDSKLINKKVDALRRALRDKSRQDVKRLARAVDRDVMQPVRKLLGQTRRVFISPDNTLNLIPFAALVDEDGEYLVKKYHFTYLTSGRDLLRLQEKFKSKAAPVMMADADFDHDAASDQASADQYAANNLNQAKPTTDTNTPSAEQAGPRLGDVEFEPLKRLFASAEEAASVKKILDKVTVFLRSGATETVLKQAASPSILHIATHGFFLEEEVKPGEIISESTRLAVRRKKGDQPSVVKLLNPALRSGLFFAGANQRKSGEDDGVLTALEAAGLDLWGTKLVVLSACDTGVGEVLNGEGVQGLRRALVLAGSESQIMSLWPVSDRGTRDLIIEYYKGLKAGKGRSEALRQVQLSMLKNPERQHPYYWASFIQSGEWANLDGKR